MGSEQMLCLIPGRSTACEQRGSEVGPWPSPWEDPMNSPSMMKLTDWYGSLVAMVDFFFELLEPKLISV